MSESKGKFLDEENSLNDPDRHKYIKLAQLQAALFKITDSNGEGIELLISLVMTKIMQAFQVNQVSEGDRIETLHRFGKSISEQLNKLNDVYKARYGDAK